MDKLTYLIILASIAALCITITISSKIKYKSRLKKINDYIDSLKIPTLSINDRIVANTQLLVFIDKMIELEVFNEKRFEIILDAPDKKIDIDEVMKLVSQKVFESINPDIFSNADNIVTPKYLMGYIQKRTFIYCMQYMQNNTVEQE